MKKLKYLGVYISPLVIGLCLYLGDYRSIYSLLFFFGLLPAIELILPPDPTNLEKWEEELVKNDRFYDYLIYLLVPIQYFLLFYFLQSVSTVGLSSIDRICLATTMGLSCGILGINTAHELGHRNTKYEQLMGQALLLTSLYMHFFIEHNRGHHKNVSTINDPTSSRRGESVYAFYFRAIISGYLSAWHLENERLLKLGYSKLHWSNLMLRFQIIQIAFCISIGIIWGWTTMFYFLWAALLGILLLETVNYIEHYGLSRKMIDGVYERTSPIHSWNSNHPLGRIMLFELSRHSDHHYIPNRKYQLLRHHDTSPQMPTGYPGMMLLSLLPPLWFSIMHPKIDSYKATAFGSALG